MPVLTARGALDDLGRFFILDWERNRHVRQEQGLIDNENREENVWRFPGGPFLGTTATSGSRLGRGSRRWRVVHGRSHLGVLLRDGWRGVIGTRWHSVIFPASSRAGHRNGGNKGVRPVFGARRRAGQLTQTRGMQGGE